MIERSQRRHRDTAVMVCALVVLTFGGLCMWWVRESRWWLLAAFPLVLTGMAGLVTELAKPAAPKGWWP